MDIWWLARKIRAKSQKKSKYRYFPLIFPITYFFLTIWLILITFDARNYWIRWMAKFMGVMLGFFTAIRAGFFGEQWLAVDNLNNLALTQFNDGFALPLALILIAVGLVQLYLLAFSIMTQDWKVKETINE